MRGVKCIDILKSFGYIDMTRRVRACGVTAALSSIVTCVVWWNLIKTENGSFMRAPQFLLFKFPQNLRIEISTKRRMNIYFESPRSCGMFFLYHTNSVEQSCSKEKMGKKCFDTSKGGRGVWKHVQGVKNT